MKKYYKKMLNSLFEGKKLNYRRERKENTNAAPQKEDT